MIRTLFASCVLSTLLLLTGLAAPADATVHPFRILEVRSDEDRKDPRACLALSAEVAKKQRHHIADYVSVEPDRGDHPVVLRETTVCIGNLEHGVEYTLAIRGGLRDISGRPIAPDDHRVVKVPDRPPRAKFAGGGYVLPMVGSLGIALTTVNVDEVSLSLLRITEGNLVDQVMRGRIGRQLDGWDLDTIDELLGEQLWQGTVTVKGDRNREAVTAVPVDTLMPERKPGVYLLAVTAVAGTRSDGSADSTREDPYGRWQDRPTQWLVVSDIGLMTFRGADGLTVFARSLATAGPLAGVTLGLQARNEDILAELTTDANGRAAFAPGLLRGSGGRRAVLLKARSAAGGHTFLSLTGAAFDLSNHGVGGRPAPGPVEAYVYTDRGIYRPGETVHLTALVRDDRGHAVSALPLDLAVVRPDGVAARRLVVRSDETGAVPFNHALIDTAVTGAWRYTLSLPDGGATVGETTVQVADFVPPRIEVSAEAAEAFAFRSKAQVTIAARFLYGAPGADLAITGRVRVEVDPEPFATWPGYHFGLADDRPIPARADMPKARTGEDGTATLPLALPAVVESTRPLRVRVEAAVLERGGRPVGTTLVRPLRDGRERIGLRPRFDGSVGTATPAVFDVALLDAAGEAIAGRSLEWHLYREEREFFWYRTKRGRWEYRRVTSDNTVDSGILQTSANPSEPAHVDLQADWGTYRLEVTDPGSRSVLPASAHFRVGWGRNDDSETPDVMAVRLDRDRYAAGETATVRLEASFDGSALVTVLTDQVAQAHNVEVVDGKASLTLPVKDWTAGAYVAAAVFRPAPPGAAQGPQRAVGVAWLAVEPGRRLSVAFDAPSTAVSGAPVPVAFRVTNDDGVAVPARLTVTAVDEGILQMTGFKSPNPAAVVFGKRRLAVELRDLYGRLIDARKGRPGVLRSGGDTADALFGGIQPPRKTVVLYHGMMRTDAAGRGKVMLDVPEGFSGRLRLMAVAHTKDALGHGRGDLIVRDPLMADIYLPRFLAPGDQAGIMVEVVNADGPAGDYRPTLSVTGPASIAGALPTALNLAPGERRAKPLTLSATAPGDVVLRLRVSGPQGITVQRSWTLAVRPAQAWRQRWLPVALGPGESVTLSEALTSHLYGADARVSVSLSPVPYDLHGLLASLDRYPYGCTEQVISRALPLLYVRELGKGASQPADDPGLQDRIQNAVWRVLSRQRFDGSFGLWSAKDAADPWVSAYALDFLDRARAEGFEVHEAALRRSQGYLTTLLNQREPSVEAAAYGLAVLARSKAVDAGKVRSFVDTHLDAVRSGLGRAQVALAKASFGLSEDVDVALAAAVSASGGGRYPTYGSDLRDAAALVSVAAALKSEVLEEAAARLRRLTAEDGYTSTQEKAWMVVAAWELSRAMAGAPLIVNGVRISAGRGGFHRALSPQDLQGEGLTIANAGDRPVTLTVSVGGHPKAEEAPYAERITVKRTLLTLEGLPAEPDKAKQGDEFLVVLDGKLSHSQFTRRLLVVDLLPAGLEIQAAIKDLEGYEFLVLLDRPGTLRLRDDRYVAALTRGSGRFRLAYLVRAVTPGTFRLPAPYVEDMYDPTVQARGAMGLLTIQP